MISICNVVGGIGRIRTAVICKGWAQEGRVVSGGISIAASASWAGGGSGSGAAGRSAKGSTCSYSLLIKADYRFSAACFSDIAVTWDVAGGERKGVATWREVVAAEALKAVLNAKKQIVSASPGTNLKSHASAICCQSGKEVRSCGRL